MNATKKLEYLESVTLSDTEILREREQLKSELGLALETLKHLGDKYSHRNDPTDGVLAYYVKFNSLYMDGEFMDSLTEEAREFMWDKLLSEWIDPLYQVSIGNWNNRYADFEKYGNVVDFESIELAGRSGGHLVVKIFVDYFELMRVAGELNLIDTNNAVDFINDYRIRKNYEQEDIEEAYEVIANIQLLDEFNQDVIAEIEKMRRHVLNFCKTGNTEIA